MPKGVDHTFVFSSLNTAEKMVQKSLMPKGVDHFTVDKRRQSRGSCKNL